MDGLISDIIVYICRYLINDRDKIHFLSTNMQMFCLTQCVYFHNYIATKMIYHTSYFDRFTNVCSDLQTKIPRSCIILTLYYDYNEPINNKIPPGVKYLNLG